MEKSVLVIGGAGYVGGRLVDLLQRRGSHTTVYDALLYEERFLKNVPFVRGDIRDRHKLTPLIKSHDVIVILAALVGDGACASDRLLAQTINLDAAALVAAMAGIQGKKVIFTSTCSVYGKSNKIIDESGSTNPLSVYADTKLKAEGFIAEVPNHLIFRFGTLYGVGDTYSRVRFDLVVNYFTKLAAEGKEITVIGGQQYRPLVHVKDAAFAIYQGIVFDVKGLYNLVAENKKIIDIAKIVCKVTGATIRKSRKSVVDNRNYRVLGEKWEKRIMRNKYRSIEEGVAEVAEILKEGRIVNPDSAIYFNERHLCEAHRPIPNQPL